MSDYETRLGQAKAYYQAGLEKVKTTPEPAGQKFAKGTRVQIVEDLGIGMSHFPSGVGAIVAYTYAHAYGGDNIDSYSLIVDDYGSSAWYKEWQLTAI